MAEVFPGSAGQRSLPPSVQEYCEKHDKDLRVVPPDFLDLNSLSIAGIFWRLHLTDSRTQTQY